MFTVKRLNDIALDVRDAECAGVDQASALV